MMIHKRLALACYFATSIGFMGGCSSVKQLGDWTFTSYSAWDAPSATAVAFQDEPVLVGFGNSWADRLTRTASNIGAARARRESSITQTGGGASAMSAADAFAFAIGEKRGQGDINIPGDGGDDDDDDDDSDDDSDD